MPLTDDRVQEIERLRAGITNKPLRARKASDNTGDYGVMTYDEEPEGPAPDLLLAEVFERIGSNKIHDASFMAEFFAASPTIVDDLLAERRELLAEIDRLTYDRDLQESVAIWGTGDRAT